MVREDKKVYKNLGFCKLCLLRKLLQSKLILSILLALNILLFTKLNFFVSQLSGNSVLFDFNAYRRLVLSIRSGINPYAVEHMQTLGPPLVFLYFIPFSFLTTELGQTIFSAINICCGFLTCWILAKKFYPQKKLFVFFVGTFILFSSFPTRFSIEIGQPTMVATFLVAIIITQARFRKKGVVLAFLITIKTFFLFSILAFIKRNQRVIWTSIAYLFFFFLLSLVLIEPNWYAYYLREKSPSLIQTGNPPWELDYYNQSIKSTLSRLGMFGAYEPLYALFFIICSVLIIFTGSFELSVPIALLLSPVSWQHYFVILFPVFIKGFFCVQKDFKKILLLLIALGMWWIEFPWLHQAETTLINGVLASHYFFSAILLTATLVKAKPASKTKTRQ